MKEIPQISDAEWQVMKVLWLRSPLPFSEIVKELRGRAAWSPKTIQTLLTRLVNKNALSYEAESRGYLYYPAVSENECVREVSKSFLQKVYDGSLNLMVKNFLDSNELSEKDIEELKKILKDR